MNKRRLLILFGLMALLMLRFPLSAAEETLFPVPERSSGDSGPSVRIHPLPNGADGLTVEIETEGRFVTGKTVRVRARAAGGDGNYTYFFQALVRDPLEDDENAYYSVRFITQKKEEWKLPLYEPGQLYLVVQVTDGSGETVSSGDYNPDYEYMVTGENLVQKKAKELTDAFMSEYPLEYERALAAHDWLTSSANYDSTGERHGPEGVLLEGTGVCESYGRAFCLLMKLMGIESRYVRGTAGGTLHGWNKVKLNGIWCSVDCTWDDPNNGGYENHIYFGLSDPIIGRDHTEEPEEKNPAGRSMANYYYIRSGQIDEWIAALEAELADAAAKNRQKAEIAIPDMGLKLENGYYCDHPTCWYILEYALNNGFWKGAEKGYSLGVTYHPGKRQLVVTYAKETGTCFLPASATELDPEMLAGTAFRKVVLPDRAVHLKVGCLAGSAAEEVVIPNAKSTVDPDAFSGLEGIRLIAPPDLKIGGMNVAEYCETKDFTYDEFR